MKNRFFINLDIMIGFALGLFSLGAFYLSYIMFKADPVNSSSGALPLGVSSVMLFLSAGSLIKLFKGSENVSKNEFDTRIPIATVMLICYAVLIQFAGFYISTFVFTSILSSWLGKGKVKSSLLFSAVFTIVLWIVFGTVFKVALP